MTEVTASTVSNDNLLMALFSRKAIQTLTQTVVLYQMSDKYPLPKGSGKSMTFSAWRKIAAPTAALSEYSTSAGDSTALSSRKVAATLASYGKWVRISTDLEDESIIPVIEGAVKELSDCASLTLDNVIQMAAFGKTVGAVGAAAKTTILSAWVSSHTSGFCSNTRANHAAGVGATTDSWGFPVVFGSSATRLSAINASSASLSARMGPVGIRKAAIRLQRLAARPQSDGSFVLVTSPQAIGSLFANSLYTQYVVNYNEGPKESIFPGEIKHSIYGCRIVVSQNMPVYRKAATASALSACVSLVLGQGALAVTELAGGIEMFVKRPTESSTNDPLDLMRTVAFKYRGAAAVLDPSSGVVLITVDSAINCGA